MIKVYNWEYEYGMKRIAFYKELGHEIKLYEKETTIDFYRDGSYYATMDKKGVTGGYHLKQTLQGNRLKPTLTLQREKEMEL